MSLKQKTISGVFWSSVERFSVQGVQFIIQIIMARLILPKDYGIVGMLAIFLAISQSFIDSGFSNALIRKQDRTQIDYSTVFYFNIVVGIVFYLILFFSSGLIANFFDTPVLVPLTKIMALNIVFNSLTIVQRAILTVKVDFKTQSIATLTSAIISGVVGVWMAYNDYGVWALAWQTVINGFLIFILLSFLTKWRPILVFSWQSFKGMFSFGSKLLLSGLIDTIYRNIYLLVIGKFFSASTLGCYTRADQFAQFPSSNLTGIFSRVTFPILSSIQDDDNRLRNVYRKYIKLTCFIVFPLMVGLASLSKPFVLLLLTETWSDVIVLLFILCFSYMWYPVHALNLNLLQVKGRSDLFLRLEIIKKIIGVTIIFITLPIGVVAMCIGSIASSFICLAINTHYTGKLINVGFLKQIKDLLPILLQSLLMGVVVWFSIGLFESNIIKLIFGVFMGIVSYALLAYSTKSKEFGELLVIIKLKK